LVQASKSKEPKTPGAVEPAEAAGYSSDPCPGQA
jgi:hypothetical protein